VAQALLPIGDDTLVYGSSDAGVNVRTDSREVSLAFFVLSSFFDFVFVLFCFW
jgi:hypothetical protein